MTDAHLDSAAIMKMIKENHSRLDSCKRHLFDFTDYKVGKFKTMKCEICGGEMRPLEAGIYGKGYAASGNPITDVLKGWS